MEFFARTAYFEISENILKGRIVPFASNPSPWVYSQDFALYLLDFYFEKGKVLHDETVQIYDMIRNWHPPIGRYEIDFFQPEVVILPGVLKPTDPFADFLDYSQTLH